MSTRLSDVDLTEVRDEIARVSRAGVWLLYALVAVGIGALIFTMVNVTLFAYENGVPWPIAVLLDPLASVSLASMLLARAVLSRHGRPADGWAVVLMLTAGAATWAMNIWTSVAAGDAAGVLLHSVAPALVILLAEATPRVLRQFAELIADLQQRADTETDTRQREAEVAAEAQRRENQRLADEAREREAAERAEREREREAIAERERERRNNDVAQLAALYAVTPVLSRRRKPQRSRPATSKTTPPRPKTRDELGAKRSEHTTEAIDAAILAAWDRGERPTGGQLDRAHGTNNYARSRLALLRKQHPGREPETAAQA